MNLASLAEKNLADYGEYERLVYEGKSFTNRALHERSCRLAAALVALGCRPGDKVVVMMPNSPDVLVAYPAIWRAGLTVIPVLFVLDARELAYILENSGAKAVITSPEVQPKVAEAMRGLEGICVIVTDSVQSGVRPSGNGDVPAGSLSFSALASRGEPLAEVVARRPDDAATILYTSGTTGQPKGVVQTHRNLHANALNAWNTATRRDRSEVVLMVLPLAHTFGLSALLSGYLFGNRGILMPRFDPEGALALIERYQVNYMAGVPTMFVLMAMHPAAGKYDTSSVRRWLVGAAPMPTQQLVEFETKFGGTMYVGYGLSEAGPTVASEREGMPRKLGSTGVPVVGVEVKIVDDEGREVPRNQIGEICARGDNVSPGYYENPVASAESFRDGWLFTGDMGYLDDEGYLFIKERKKDLVIRGGLNVYPKDVEEVIHRHPAVLEAAVVGVPDVRMGEEVCVYLVRRPGAALSAEDVIAHCQSNLAKYKTPRYVEFVNALPKTSLGKIQKKEVRRLAAERVAEPAPASMLERSE
jgi:long-chain acyl-CoA synthetase